MLRVRGPWRCGNLVKNMLTAKLAQNCTCPFPRNSRQLGRQRPKRWGKNVDRGTQKVGRKLFSLDQCSETECTKVCVSTVLHTKATVILFPLKWLLLGVKAFLWSIVSFWIWWQRLNYIYLNLNTLWCVCVCVCVCVCCFVKVLLTWYWGIVTVLGSCLESGDLGCPDPYTSP